jgi:hypothetical protein
MLRVLLIGCAGAVTLTFAGVFRMELARTNRFDTNLLPTYWAAQKGCFRKSA